jgi:hypothetical protein
MDICEDCGNQTDHINYIYCFCEEIPNFNNNYFLNFGGQIKEMCYICDLVEEKCICKIQSKK